MDSCDSVTGPQVLSYYQSVYGKLVVIDNTAKAHIDDVRANLAIRRLDCTVGHLASFCRGYHTWPYLLWNANRIN